MNYTNIYYRFISTFNNPSSHTNKKGFERHHIKPKSLGGSDDLSNLVDLTARQHFFAHKLLAKIHGEKMIAALFYMANTRDNLIPSRTYAKLREKYIDLCKKRIGDKNPFFNKSHSEETKQKISKKQKGKPIRGEQLKGFKTQWKTGLEHRWHKNNRDIHGDKNPFFNKSHSEETKNIISEKAKERFKDKNNHPLFGVGHTDEAKENIKNSWVKNIVICPHCHKQGEQRAMKRWHFNNCNFKL